MHSNVMWALGELIEQNTGAQLARDWEMDRAAPAREPGLSARIFVLFVRVAAALKAGFKGTAPQPARV